MRPEQIFDNVLEQVREFRSAGAPAIQHEKERTGGGSTPIGNVEIEYMAEFYLAGKRALAERWPRRWDLFRIYYYGGTPYRSAIRLMRVPKGVFDWWAQQIKKHVGIELEESGLKSFRRYREKTTQ